MPLPPFLSCCVHVSLSLCECTSLLFPFSLSDSISVIIEVCLSVCLLYLCTCAHLPLRLYTHLSLSVYVPLFLRSIAQDLSSHLRGVLATQAVLEGMGVGRAGSTPLAATLQWMARDGEQNLAWLYYP